MQCEQARELYSDYVARDLDRALAVSMDNHVADCATCREEVAGLKQVWGTLESLTPVDPPAFFHENLVRRLDMEDEKAAEARTKRGAGWDWRSLLRPRALAYAATILVLLLAGLGGLHSQRAEMDPLGTILKWLVPAPKPVLELQTAHADWLQGTNGGVLTVRLQAAPASDGGVNKLTYRIRTMAGKDLKVGTVTSTRETQIRLSLEELPANSALTILLTDPHNAAASQTQPLLIASAPSL